jgi:hypothetical protein
MRFFVEKIISHTDKSNYITYQIIDTNTILDGCNVYGYAPKSVELVPGVTQEIPYFVANGIFGFNRHKNIKSLEKQLQEKAPKGQKRIWRAQASDLFSEISKLNIEELETEKEPEGSFLGEVGDTITFIFKEIFLLHSHNWISFYNWHHNGHGWERPSGTKCMWKLIDDNGQEYMFSSSGNVTNNKLETLQRGTIVEAVISENKIFRNKRQTWIKKIKFNQGLFSLLS